MLLHSFKTFLVLWLWVSSGSFPGGAQRATKGCKEVWISRLHCNVSFIFILILLLLIFSITDHFLRYLSFAATLKSTKEQSSGKWSWCCYYYGRWHIWIWKNIVKNSTRGWCWYIVKIYYFVAMIFFYLFLNLFSCLFSHSVKVIYGPPLSDFTHSEGANFDDDCSVSMECTTASYLDGGGGKPIGTSCWWLCWALLSFWVQGWFLLLPFQLKGFSGNRQINLDEITPLLFWFFLRCDNLLAKQRNYANFLKKGAVF